MKKHIQRMIIFLAAVLMAAIIPVSANAATVPNNGGYYYIQNANMGENDQRNVIELGSLTSGYYTVNQRILKGSLSQVWKAVKYSDGSFSFVSRFNTTQNYALNIPNGSSADLLALIAWPGGGGAGHERWTLTNKGNGKMNPLSIWTGKSFTTGGATGGTEYSTIVQKPSSSITNWLFIPTAGTWAYGYADSGTYTSPVDVGIILNDFNNMGYTAYTWVDRRAPYIFDTDFINTPDIPIVLFLGHGLYSEVDNSYGGAFYTSPTSHIYAHNYGHTFDATYYRYLNELPDYSLSNCRLMIFMNCYSGFTSRYFGNLVDEAYLKGAQTVIGWRTTILYYQAVDWGKGLAASLKNGNTIASAIAYGDAWVEQKYGEGNHGNTILRYTRGSQEQTLIRR